MSDKLQITHYKLPPPAPTKEYRELQSAAYTFVINNLDDVNDFMHNAFVANCSEIDRLSASPPSQEKTTAYCVVKSLIDIIRYRHPDPSYDLALDIATSYLLRFETPNA